MFVILQVSEGDEILCAVHQCVHLVAMDYNNIYSYMQLELMIELDVMHLCV